jgi:hypothetical protein
MEDIDEDLLFETMKTDYEHTGEKSSFELLLNKENRASRIGVANKRQQKMLNT